mmetsp:Transcript_105776/g.297963  ORF Transcript_105776/g.297963 Transcript_105776/m.297963 type:complete len:302 (-) Transcript_105776:746-1651(-)
MDHELCQHIEDSRHAVHEVHLSELPENGADSPEVDESSERASGLEQAQVQALDHIDQLTDTEGMTFGLLPTAVACSQISILLRCVVQQRQEDGFTTNPASCHQGALGVHVPILGEVVGIPTADRGGQRQAQRVAGVVHMAIHRIRESSQLAQRGEEGRHPDEQGLPQVVFEVADGRLPRGNVPPRGRCCDEVVCQGLKVVLVELGIIVHDSDHHSGIVAVNSVVPFQLRTQGLEGKALVGGLAWHVVREVRRVEGDEDEAEAALELRLQQPRLLDDALLVLLEGEHHAHASRREVELLQSL